MTDHSGKPPLLSGKTMSQGQKAYEERRAGKAGHTLEQWIDVKAREKRAAERRANYVPKRVGWVKKILARLRGLFGRDAI